MRKAVVSAGLVAVFLAAVAMAGMTIGLVDTKKIAAEEPRFIGAQKEIDNMVGQFGNERDTYERELKDLSDRLERAQSGHGQETVEMYGRQMAEKSREYQKFMAETFGPGGIIETQTDSIMAPMYAKLEQACRKVGEQLRIPLILDREQLSPLYAADTLDVTAEVLAELKKTW